MCVFVLIPLLLPSRESWTQVLSSECKSRLTKLILQSGCLSHHIISRRKSALIQKLQAQIAKAFHQQGIAEKANDLGINASL